VTGLRLLKELIPSVNYCKPAIPYIPLAPDSRGRLVRPDEPRLGNRGEDEFEVPRTKDDLVASRLIDSDRLRDILKPGERKTILFLGRSGIMDEGARGVFMRKAEDITCKAFSILRRVGVYPEEHFNVATSLTEGIIDVFTREIAFRFGLPVIAFANEWYIKTADYVRTDSVTMPHIYRTGDGITDYSRESSGFSDLVFCMGGAEYTFLHDVPQSILQNKSVVMYADESLPPWEEIVGQNGLDSNGSKRLKMGNCCLLVRDNPNYAYGMLSDKLTFISGRRWSNEEVSRRIKVIDREEALAQVLYELSGGVGDVMSKFNDIKENPIPLEQIGAGLFRDVSFVLSVAGRSQYNNKPNSFAEKSFVENFVDKLVFYLRWHYAISPYEIFVIHGMSDYGSDRVFLDKLLSRGFRGYGVVRPLYADYVNSHSKFISPYVLTDDTDKAYSSAYVGNGYSDLLLACEGNGGVAAHVEAAIDYSVPVIITPITEDSAISIFFDQQDGKEKLRITNIAPYFQGKIAKGNSRYSGNLSFTNEASLVARFISRSILLKRGIPSVIEREPMLMLA